ncbi:MAG: hypothetical protein ACOYM3_19465 [Terrimicrobiaceae bacterium]
MKRKNYIFVIGVLACVAVALLLFIMSKRTTKDSVSSPQSLMDSVPSVSSPATSEPTEAQLNAPSRITQDKPKEEVIKEYFSKQIDFYGVVKDDADNPVAGANIEYSVYSSWLSPNQKAVAGPQTDGNGRFAITGKQGASIFVKVMHLSFYETGQSHINFSFAKPVEPLPTASNPYVFVLRKKGDAEPLLKQKQVLRNVPKDGQPVRVALAGVSGTDLTIQAWTSPRPAGAVNNAPFEWKVRVEVPEGGLVAYEDAYRFEAPAEGYAPSVEFAMPASGIDGKWRDRFEETFFVKLANGNYARMRFQMIAGGNHFAVVESYFNPTPGSRNLEFDPAKIVKSP